VPSLILERVRAESGRSSTRFRAGGLTAEQGRGSGLDADANSIGVAASGILARVQDDHVADAFGTEQVWLAAGWEKKQFGPCRFEPEATGGTRTGRATWAAQAAWRGCGRSICSPGNHDAVHEQTVRCVKGLAPEEEFRPASWTGSWGFRRSPLGVRLGQRDLRRAPARGGRRRFVARGSAAAQSLTAHLPSPAWGLMGPSDTGAGLCIRGAGAGQSGGP